MSVSHWNQFDFKDLVVCNDDFYGYVMPPQNLNTDEELLKNWIDLKLKIYAYGHRLPFPKHAEDNPHIKFDKLGFDEVYTPWIIKLDLIEV